MDFGQFGHELAGTVLGRWYVTLFGLTFFWCSVRQLGWRKTLSYAGIAVVVGGLAENGSVHIGFPYTKYAFDEALRGEELYLFDVPLMVPLSYTFMAYFAFAMGRIIASGPRHTRAEQPWMEWLMALVIGVWALWIVDPVVRLGKGFYLGEVFTYDGPGFWFNLPLGSQLGFTLTVVVLAGILFWMDRTAPDVRVSGFAKHPHLVAFITYHAQVFHMAIIAIFFIEGKASDAIGGSAFLMWIPIAAMTAVYWRTLRLVEERGGARTKS